jgi:hypothetical protein
MAKIRAHALLQAVLVEPERRARTEAVLPFFSARLQVKFLLVVFPDGRCSVLQDLPRRASRRVLQYPFPARHTPLDELRAADFEQLYHYDPWWLLRGREDLDADLLAAIVASNIAGRKLEGAEVLSVYYHDTLLDVVGARVRRRLLGTRFLGPDALIQALS